MEAIVIGAGPAGLAAAACLGRAGLSAIVLERGEAVGGAFQRQFDNLTLQTARARSGLPFAPMPPGARYPSGADYLTYLRAYAKRMLLTVLTRTQATRVDREGPGWAVTTSRGTRHADIVVLATGMNGRPRRPDWAEIGSFAGPVIHSSAYRSPCDFAGQRLLVVGFGNSGHDIVLDLARAGVHVDVAVRGSVNLLPRDILGLPTTSLGALRRLFPPDVADRLVMPMMRLAVGHPRRYGMRQSPRGPIATILSRGTYPVFDHGALALIARRQVGVRAGIVGLDGARVAFADGADGRYDAIILATGYDTDVAELLPDVEGVIDEAGRPCVSGAPTSERGLYFAAYAPSVEGQLRQAGLDARAIAIHAAAHAHEPLHA